MKLYIQHILIVGCLILLTGCESNDTSTKDDYYVITTEYEIDTATEIVSEEQMDSYEYILKYNYTYQGEFDFQRFEEKEYYYGPSLVEEYRAFFRDNNEYWVVITGRDIDDGKRYFISANRYEDNFSCEKDVEEKYEVPQANLELILHGEEYYTGSCELEIGSEMGTSVKYEQQFDYDFENSYIEFCDVLQISPNEEEDIFEFAYKTDDYVCEIWSSGDEQYYVYWNDDVIYGYEVISQNEIRQQYIIEYCDDECIVENFYFIDSTYAIGAWIFE